VAGATVAAALVAALSALPGAAGADPAATVGPADTMRQLSDLAHESEVANEAVLNAQMAVDAKLAAQRAAEEQQVRDAAAVAAARAHIAEYQPMIDKIAAATYMGARQNPLAAILMSDSPQQVIDQMTALDAVSSETGSKVADQARAEVDRLHVRQGELTAEIGRVVTAWAGLSTPDRAAFAGSPFPPGFNPDVLLRGLAPGTGSGALQAGLTRIGAPYVWGATGPTSFDCSGLVQWAFKQVGKNLPRTSQAQMQGGVPVAREDLQPGDVVIFYPGATHVGIYAGDGNVLHASTFGVPVAVASMDSMPYNTARRY
jgi:cell wall-associated NlpC family hydrolase